MKLGLKDVSGNSRHGTLTGYGKYGDPVLGAHPTLVVEPGSTQSSIGTGGIATLPVIALAGDFFIEALCRVGAHSTSQAERFFTTPSQSISIERSATAPGKVNFQISGGTTLVSAAAVPTGTLFSFALGRQGTTLRGFLDGVMVSGTVGTSTFNESSVLGMAAGAAFTLVALRITVGVCRQTANYTPSYGAFPEGGAGTKLLLQMDGTNGSTTITDAMGSTVTANGNAQISTTQSKFGGASLLLDGSGDYLTIPDSPLLVLGAGDWTFETWVRFSDVTGGQIILDKRNTNGAGPFVFYKTDAAGGHKFSGLCSVDASTWGVSLVGTTTVTTGVWYHVAFTRSGTTYRLFVNGVQEASTSVTGTVMTNTLPLRIGGAGDGSGWWFNGHLDGLHLSGICRYAANFTPPASAPTVDPVTGDPYWANVALLSHMDPAVEAPVLIAPDPRHREFIDREHGGYGIISGTVKNDGSPDVPVSRRTRLIREDCGTVIAEQWSDPETGAYEFPWINPRRTYTVVADDHTEEYRAVVADRVVPDAYEVPVAGPALPITATIFSPATWNTATALGAATFSEGNKHFHTTASSFKVEGYGTGLRATGKFYWEVVNVSAGNGGQCGFSANALSDPFTSGPYFWHQTTTTGTWSTATGGSAGPNLPVNAAGTVIGVAVDFDTGKVWLAANNVWASGDPALGDAPAFTFAVGALNGGRPVAGVNGTFGGGAAMRLKTTAADLVYAPPAGFFAWDGTQ